MKSPNIAEYEVRSSFFVYSVGIGIDPSSLHFHIIKNLISVPTYLAPNILLGQSVLLGVTIGLIN